MRSYDEVNESLNRLFYDNILQVRGASRRVFTYCLGHSIWLVIRDKYRQSAFKQKKTSLIILRLSWALPDSFQKNLETINLNNFTYFILFDGKFNIK